LLNVLLAAQRNPAWANAARNEASLDAHLLGTKRSKCSAKHPKALYAKISCSPWTWFLRRRSAGSFP
jgi:hypothetical protein